MIRSASLLLLFFALGCGGSEPTVPSTTGQNGNGPSAARMSEAEAKVCITEYFSKLGLSNLELVAISQPVETPSGMGAGWAYSVSLKCDNIVGDNMTNNHWVVIVGEENGTAKVKAHFDSMAKITESLGKEWFAKAGFSEPTGYKPLGLPMPGSELPLLPVGLPEPLGQVVPAGFPLPDLPTPGMPAPNFPPPPSLPVFEVPK